MSTMKCGLQLRQAVSTKEFPFHSLQRSGDSYRPDALSALPRCPLPTGAPPPAAAIQALATKGSHLQSSQENCPWLMGPFSSRDAFRGCPEIGRILRWSLMTHAPPLQCGKDKQGHRSLPWLCYILWQWWRDYADAKKVSNQLNVS